MTKELATQILRGEVLGTNEQTHEAVFMAIKALKNEQKHGQWIKMSDADGVYWACSECGEDIPRVAHYNPQFDLFPRLESIYRTRFCPNCGARMDDVEKIGHWVDHIKDFWCSECGCRILPEQVDSFSKCPLCGVKMIKNAAAVIPEKE